MRFCNRLSQKGIWVLLASLLFAGSVHSQTSNEKIKKALRLIDLGNPQQALADLRHVVSESPKDAETHAALALAMIEVGDVTGADKEVATAYDLERKNVLVRIARGTLYGKQGKPSDAIEEFNRAVKINDKEIATYLYFARYYLSVDSLKSAEINLYRAQNVNANDIRPLLGLADLYEKQRIIDLAISQYKEAIKLNSNDVTIYAKLAQLYFRAGRYFDAVKEWDNLVKVDTNYSRAYFEMAHIYDIGNDHVNAAKYGEKFLEKEPDNIEGIWLVARSLSESNQYEKALPYLEKAAKNDSLKTYTDLYLARSYFFAKDYTKANQLYAASKKLNAYDFYYYGYSLVSSGDTSGGIEKLKLSAAGDTSAKGDLKAKARQLIISYLNVQKKYGDIAEAYLDAAKDKKSADDYTTAGQFFNAAGKTNEAISSFDEALKINPKSVKAMVGSADATSKNPENLNTAEKKLDDALIVAATPEEKEVVGGGYARLGIQYYTAKNYDACVKVLENKALKSLGPKSPLLINVYKVGAAGYLQLKNNKKALEYYKNAEALDPKDEDVKKGLEFLKSQGK